MGDFTMTQAALTVDALARCSEVRLRVQATAHAVGGCAAGTRFWGRVERLNQQEAILGRSNIQPCFVRVPLLGWLKGSQQEAIWECFFEGTRSWLVYWEPKGKPKPFLGGPTWKKAHPRGGECRLC